MSRVAVLMSGGVDSSAAALMLADGGHEIIGITARMWDRGSRCCDDEDIERARRVCHALGMRHIVLDLRREFEERVVAPFRSDYMRGTTPNPCAVCNREIKFGELFRTAMTYGCDLVATGHYAGLGERGCGVLLKEPACREKSQTYFLTLVDPGVLGRLTFPLAASSKDAARALLARRGLEARPRESQDLCFITNGKYEEFLRSRPGGEGAAGQGGNLLDTDGNVVGSHRGHFAYTIGQRLGHHGRRTYVIEKRPEANEVVVGEREAAMVRSIEAREANWFVDPGGLAGDGILVKYRYNTPAAPARISELGDGRFKVITDEPCFAPAPGQILACYSEGFLLGGGVIAGTRP
jgi:tRNA-specific 2-thiouridylase